MILLLIENKRFKIKDIRFKNMETITVLIQMFLIILVAIIAVKAKIIKHDFNSYLNKFIFYIGLPALLLVSIPQIDKNNFVEYGQFIVSNFIVQLVFALFVLLLILKFKKGYSVDASIFTTANIGNTIYLGFPFIQAVYSPEHFEYTIIYAAIVSSLTDFIIFPLLEMIPKDFKSKFEFKKMLKELAANPIIISSVIGFLLLLLNMSLPAFVQVPMESIGDTVTPLALFSIGVFISSHLKFSIKDLNIPTYVSILKLVVMPLFALLICKLFGLDEVALQTSVIISAMPAAVYTLIIAEDYKYDKKITSYTIFTSTLLFIITSTIWVAFL